MHEVLTLSLDFILSLSKLTKKENGPDEQMSGFIDWSSIRTAHKHGKNYKTLFPSVKYVRMHYKTENMTIEGKYFSLLCSNTYISNENLVLSGNEKR